MRRSYVVIGSLALAYCALATFVYFTFGAGSKPKLAPPELVGPNGVSVKHLEGCTAELPWSDVHEVKSVTRIGDKLKVKVLINASCGPGTASRPIATFEAENIRLSWSWWRDPDELVAACLCTRAFEFTIPGIQGKTPNVVLVR